MQAYWRGAPIDTALLSMKLRICRPGSAIGSLAVLICTALIPPLVRSLAAIPVLLAGCETDWSEFTETPYARPEFGIGSRFAKINGFRTFWLFTISRFASFR
jgi:hypothetical protein